MKYGKRIIREAINKFPYDQGATRKDLLLAIKRITPSKEGIFGLWIIKIHYILSYFPK